MLLVLHTQLKKKPKQIQQNIAIEVTEIKCFKKKK